jgi:hypothetical protein
VKQNEDSGVQRDSLKVCIVVQDPVPGVQVALQSGQGSSGQSVMTCTTTKEPLTFEINLEVGSLDSATAKFRGPFIQKDAKGQFVYLRWGQEAGDATTCISRRTKLYLNDFHSSKVAKAMREGAPVTMTIPGKAKDGWPVCATVLAQIAWPF